MLELFAISGNINKNSGYARVQKIRSPSAVTASNFARCAALSTEGEVLVVGASNDNQSGLSSGSAYIYTRQENGIYSTPQKIIATDATTAAYFGESVAIAADAKTIVIGSPGASGPSAQGGAAYVFTRQPTGSYLQTSKLSYSSGVFGDRHGVAVSVSDDGTVIAVGANGATNASGSVFIYIKLPGATLYTLYSVLRASDAVAGDVFGSSVTISADSQYIVIGAPYKDDGGTNTGAAYIFKRSGYTYSMLSKIYRSADSFANNFLGRTISLSGNGAVVAIGSGSDTADGSYAYGSVYLYLRGPTGSYAAIQKITPTGLSTHAKFGFSVSLSADGEVLIIGAPFATARGAYSGNAWVFKKNESGTYDQYVELAYSALESSGWFGYNAIFSADGTKAVVSAPKAYSGAGGVYIFDL